jgi:hypothetical protein
MNTREVVHFAADHGVERSEITDPADSTTFLAMMKVGTTGCRWVSSIRPILHIKSGRIITGCSQRQRCTFTRLECSRMVIKFQTKLVMGVTH